MDKISESGKVVLAKDGYVTVQMEREAACAKCRGCITGISGAEIQVRAKNQCGAHVDDVVKLEMCGEYFLQAVSIAYGVPLLFLLTGFSVGYFFWGIWMVDSGQEIAGFFTGLLCMVISYGLIRRKEKTINRDKYLPRATETVE